MTRDAVTVLSSTLHGPEGRRRGRPGSPLLGVVVGQLWRACQNAARTPSAPERVVEVVPAHPARPGSRVGPGQPTGAHDCAVTDGDARYDGHEASSAAGCRWRAHT